MNFIPLNRTLEAFRCFNIDLTVISCAPYGNGHINDTFLVVTKTPEQKNRRFILQSINTNVFKKPEEVMHNIERIISFLNRKESDPRRVMSLVYTKDGNAFHKDSDGRFWRLYNFIEDSLCLELPETPKDFYESAVAFGQFQYYLNDFPVKELFDTIPDFHNTPDRYKKFLAAVESDPCGRAASVKEEIQFVKDRADFCSCLYTAKKEGRLPLRVTHNDTKINNVMLDRATRSALCVIDLDTIMPGFSVTDFGDSIRFGASTAAEDEKNLDKVMMDITLFESYTEGFLKGSGGLLLKSEIELLPEGAKMMTLECGMRFLTDYLEGDTYFKTKYEGHNLDRCRTQFKLVADMDSKWDEMKSIVKKYI